ncbi:DUF885 domain-containing protein [Sandaracinobacteroides hominis]|uniref:DUF885 domain-containing protein n=1 Tax=Sandaracinobacteroides hominis TaxID=2780086 RepID=UPI001F367FA9|nr:DUF885 family protein [Sandaracinobacteroides hominis]
MLLLSSAPVALAAPTGGAAAEAGTADSRLKALYAAEFAWRRAEEGRLPGFGPESMGDRLPRVDPKSQAARLAYWQDVLKQLDAIPLDQLSPEERVNAQVFRSMVETSASEIRWKQYEIPFNADSFFWADIAPYSGEGFADADQYRRYIARIRDVPRYFDENIANMRAGLKRGFSNPKQTLVGREKTIDPYLKADASNPLLAPFRSMPTTIPAAEQAALRADGEAAIREAAVPAFTRLSDFIRNDYIPNARKSIGASDMPDGRAFYAAQVKAFTTTDMTPREIHELGLKEVARIQADMEKTKAAAGFDGSLKDFIAFLKSDPQFYAKTPHELLAETAYVVMEVNGQLKDYFGTLPRFRHGIVPVPDAIAPIYTSGRGGLENCMMNTYKLDSRPMYSLPALTLHECTPGHSFQAALALEAPERPDFRKELYFSGYGEGWGLYTEWLGTLMGVYDTPYKEFGRQSYEMWRAVRLVVDTGMHEYGWSREKALHYMKDHLALSDLEITNEVDRYISWPGQALAYKLGELTIRRLRAEAEAKLGPKFDQRAFHDRILGMGAVPLPVLEREMRTWMAAEVAKPGAQR